MFTKSCEKVADKYVCEYCEYYTAKKSSIDKHFNSKKHNVNISSLPDNKKVADIYDLTCSNCKKVYRSRVGLWKHKKNCKEIDISENIVVKDGSNNNVIQLLIKENTDFKNIIMDLVKNNSELQKQMFEVCKNSNNTIINANNNNSTTISNNKTFNLNFFLNEQCKDAMNLTEFVQSVQLSLPDLEKVDEEGYVNGMSNLIIAKLNELDVYKRPVHCSDAKRDTMHVKEDDKWEREDPENSKLIIAVKDIEKKNFLLLNDYKEKYPDCLDLESIHNDKYLHMMMTLAASGENEYRKVIKKVAKEVVIEKEHF